MKNKDAQVIWINKVKLPELLARYEQRLKEGPKELDGEVIKVDFANRMRYNESEDCWNLVRKKRGPRCTRK